MKYFDLHCDTANRIFCEDLEFNSEKLKVNSRFSKIFEKWYQCFAVFINDNTAEPFSFYKKVYENYKNKIIKAKPLNLKPILTVEGGSLIENNLERIGVLKNDGVFALTLTWNGENQIAGGAYSDVGLKPFGIEVIKRLNEQKIAVDLSHLNKKSFYKVVEYSKFPIATHSCINEVFYHKRNIDFDMAKVIKDKEGIIGLCLYSEFLGGNNIFEKFYKNVYICLENDLEDIISIGSDFDGCASKINLADIPKLYCYLKSKGIEDDTLDKLFFKNAYKYVESFDKL